MRYKGYTIQETEGGYLVRDLSGRVLVEVPTEQEAAEWVDENT